MQCEKQSICHETIALFWFNSLGFNRFETNRFQERSSPMPDESAREPNRKHSATSQESIQKPAPSIIPTKRQISTDAT